MAKFVVLIVAALTLAGCVEEGDNVTENYVSVCIDNVQYWQRINGNQGFLAPRIDTETLNYVRCQ